MTARVGTASRRLTRTVVFALAVCALCALGATNAWAAPATTTVAPTVVQQLQQGPLLAFTCDDCHAKVSDTLIPGLIFSHGAHMTFDCTACHPRFPHQRGGTDVPTMAACFNCHGLHHGPQGIIANVNADCTTCHDKPRAQHLPLDHTATYSGAAHVAAANADLNSCWLCHTKDQCDACHVAQNAPSWVTTAALTYSSGQGCIACHGQQLPRLTAPVTASNLDSSAHRGVACASCHPDFRYDTKTAGSKIWQVNAGLSCGQAGCHPKEYSVWSQSVHGTAVLSGSDMNAATCGGCHGGHDIMRLDTQAAKTALYLSGTTMCDGACHTHQAAVISYADWWHGSAYKQGSLDAPACWTCHGAHDTKALKDPASATSPENLAKTCGQPGCHQGATEAFVESSRTLPHGRPADNTANPVVAFKTNLFSGGR